jgi:hypothetical protein
VANILSVDRDREAKVRFEFWHCNLGSTLYKVLCGVLTSFVSLNFQGCLRLHFHISIYGSSLSA